MAANKPNPASIEYIDSLPARESKLVVRLFWDLSHLAYIHPNRARFVIDYAVRHLPEEVVLQVRGDVWHCLKELEQQKKAARGRGRPKAEKSRAVMNRCFRVAILRHGSKPRLTWHKIARYFDMAPSKQSTRTLTRQRDTYAKVIYKTLLDCGADPKGKNLDQILSRKGDSWPDIGDRLWRCSLPVQKAPASCAKLAREFFLLAARKK